MKRLQNVYLDANPQYKDSKAFGPEIGPGSFLQIVDIVHEIQHSCIDAHHDGPSGELIFGQSTVSIFRSFSPTLTVILIPFFS